jgi:hypothetical protein
MDKFTKSGLIFLLIYCPLAFGAVHIFSFTVMEIGVLLLLTGWLLSQIFHSPSTITGGSAIAEGSRAIPSSSREKRTLSMLEWTPLHTLGIFFISLILLQLIPWPSLWVKAISPGTFRVYKQALGTVPDFISLSLYPYATRIGLFKVLAYLGVFFLIINWADSKAKIQGLVYAFAFVGIFEALYGILRFLRGYPHIWWFENIWAGGAPSGTYINRNHLAGLLEITIPMTFGLLIATVGRQAEVRERADSQSIRERADSRIKEIKGVRGFLLSLDLGNSTFAKTTLIVFLLAMMVLGLILSGSRGGIISLSVSFLFMNSMLFFRKRFRRYVAVSFIICLIALVYGLHTGIERIVQRFENITEDSKVRIRFARTSMELKRDFPILGTGWGTFKEAYRRYQSPEDEMYELNHVHHDWIELGAEMGSLGLGLVIFVFLFCMGYFFSLWRKRKNSFSIGIGLGGMGAMVSLALHSFTDFNMHIPANALLLSMAMGIALASLIYQRKQRSSSMQSAQIRAQMGEGRGVEGERRGRGEEEISAQKRSQEGKMPERVAIHFPSWLRWPLALAVLGGFCFAVLLVIKPYLAERVLPTLPEDSIINEKRISTPQRNACTAIHYLAERVLPTLPDSTINKKRISPTLKDVCTAIHYGNGNAEYLYRLVSLLEKRMDEKEPDDNNRADDNKDDNNKAESNKDANSHKWADQQRKEEWLQVIAALSLKGADRAAPSNADRAGSANVSRNNEASPPSTASWNMKNKGGSQTEIVNNLIVLALKRAVQLDPANPYYHLKLAEYILKLGEVSENLDQLQPFMNASEKELDRSLYFMPESADSNFYAGCYWIWKSKVMEEKMRHREAFDRFIYYFKKSYHLNQRYKQNIQEAVQRYYPDDAVQARIFLNTAAAFH